MTAKSWWKLTIVLPDSMIGFDYAREVISGVVSLCGRGIEEHGNLFKAYFMEQLQAENAARRLTELFQPGGEQCLLPIQIKTEIDVLEDDNWMENWKAFFAPVRIGNCLTIIQPWGEYESRPGEIVITINPQQAFGTGLHESTRLLLRLLKSAGVQGKSLLDVGTGTGIAAIYAAKLGAKSIMAIDVDETACCSAREHAELNGVTDTIRVINSSAQEFRVGEYDIVTVNIEWTLLKDVVPPLSARLKDNGMLLISGIQCNEAELLKTLLKKMNMAYSSTLHEGDWSALAARRG